MSELITVNAGIFSSIGSFFTDRALEALGAVLLIIVGMMTKKYLIPLLKTIHARQTAEHILIIADDVTDYFMEKFPNAHWSNWLDRAVDKIMSITGVKKGPAERAARASIKRKKDLAVQGFEKIEGKS